MVGLQTILGNKGGGGEWWAAARHDGKLRQAWLLWYGEEVRVQGMRGEAAAPIMPCGKAWLPGMVGKGKLKGITGNSRRSCKTRRGWCKL